MPTVLELSISYTWQPCKLISHASQGRDPATAVLTSAVAAHQRQPILFAVKGFAGSSVASVSMAGQAVPGGGP
jgi:hypothetical protein